MSMRLPTVIAKFLHRTGSAEAADRRLIESIRTDAIPDPEVLRGQLAGAERELLAAEREWEHLRRRPEAEAFLERQPVAERVQALRHRVADLASQIEPAASKRAAALELARAHDALAENVAARTRSMIEQPPVDPRTRAEELRALSGAVRLHRRMAARLAQLSSDRRFRLPLDALSALKDHHCARIAEIDRLRSRGAHEPVEWPAHLRALIDVINNGTGVSQ